MVEGCIARDLHQDVMKEIRHLSYTVHESLRSSAFLFDLSRVVEELVHNSLDAGSTEIIVSLSIGSSYVKVEDDGCGVARDGLVILGERYATSKAGLFNDVGISTETLGFRGEALSSISDISLVEIRSKARGNPNAYCKIIKSSICLFFGIDDQRENVGTTVIVRDLFYNQPIRRKFMQSRKVLHYVKKCVLRIALVHSQVSFKVIDTEGDHKLLCTIPSLTCLPLVTDGFGNEVSSSLREIVSCGQVLALSGYISGPTDAFSTKVFQYIYINSRFICKGPIHNLINRLATTFQSTIAKWRNHTENHDRKRRKTQGYPAYLLNLSCPIPSYDLSFEPSKTRVEFKDWGAVLLFFEQSIMTYWKQCASNLFQGSGSTHKASCHDSGIEGEGIFSERTTKSSKLRAIEDNIHFHQGSISSSQITKPLCTFSDDANHYQTHSQSIDDQDYFSLPKSCHSKDCQIEVVNSFSHHIANTVMGTSTNCKKSRYMNRWRYEPCGRVDDFCLLPLAHVNASSKIYPIMENRRASSPCYSTSYVFSENHDCLKEPFSDKEENITGANWYNECLFVRDNLNFKTNSPTKEKLNLEQPVIGVIRKCQKSAPQDTSIFKVSPFFHDQACLTEETNLGHGEVAKYVDDVSMSRPSLHCDFADPLITRTPPRLQDITLDSTLIESHVYTQGADYRHYAIEEKNAEFIDAVLNDSSEGLPVLNCTGSTALDYKFCSSPMENLQYACPPAQFVPVKDSSTFLVNEGKGCMLSESIEHTEIYNSIFLNFAKHNQGYAVENSKHNEHQNSSSDVRVLRLRSHSAPPFYKGKRKFPILNHLSTDYTRENSRMKSSYVIDVPGLSSRLEPAHTSQPWMKPITNFSHSCSRELKFEKSNRSNMSEMQTCEGFDNGSAADELESTSDLLTKWRADTLHSEIYQDGVTPHEVDVLDISSGLLHLSGNALVPVSIKKGCFENTKVLQQLDRKFIPVVATGTLVIIDQHAADERIRLEDLRKKVLSGELCSSTHLNPVHELILPEMGYQLLHKYKMQIEKWGWICNVQGQHSELFARSMNLLRTHKCSATLSAVPNILGTDLMGKDFLEYIDQLVETDGSAIIPPAVIRILNYKACRGAIMFGDALLPSECSLLVEELKATSLCFQCAHGRPTTVPLLNMAALHEQLARLGVQMAGQSEDWHGLRRHTPSIRRARKRLELCKSFLHG